MDGMDGMGGTYGTNGTDGMYGSDGTNGMDGIYRRDGTEGMDVVDAMASQLNSRLRTHKVQYCALMIGLKLIELKIHLRSMEGRGSMLDFCSCNQSWF